MEKGMFGFPQADRAEINKFNRNYLKSVVFQIRFDPSDLVLEKKDKIIPIFINLFPRTQDNFQKGFDILFKSDQTPILQPIAEKDAGFELKSHDGQKVLSFTKDIISYTIAGRAYEKFDKLSEEFVLIHKALELCKIIKFNRIAIRKLNIIEFQIPDENKASPMDILGMVLSPNLLINLSYFPSINDIQQNIHTINYVKEDNRLNLRYGLIVPQINSKMGQILIDIDLFKVGGVLKKDMDEIAKSINNEIFNIFNWSISSEAVKYLKK